MKYYKVGVYETNHGNIIVPAETEELALKKAVELIDKQGIPFEIKVFDREFGAVCAEQVLV